jgi:hypothetical protein
MQVEFPIYGQTQYYVKATQANVMVLEVVFAMANPDVT